MLGGLDQQYAVAVRLHVSNIPQGIRDVTDYAIQTKIDADLKTAADQAEAEIDVAYLQSLRDTLKRWASTLINDSDQITIGWDVDPNTRRTFVELLAQAKEGSALSQQLDSLADCHSAFTGFLQDDAAIAVQGAVQVTDEGQRQVDDSLLPLVVELTKACVDVVVTSGPETGTAPALRKMALLRECCADFPLGIASGMTPENIRDFLPYADCFLVNTGISSDGGLTLDKRLTPRMAELIHA